MRANHSGDILDAGQGLTEGAIQWGERPETPPTWALTPRDLDVFSWLEQHRFATTGILTMLFWRGYGAAPRERLKLLHDVGFLDKFRPFRRPGLGTAEWIYRLTARGWDLLIDRDRAVTGRMPFGELTDLAYVAHDLQLDALLLHAASQAYPGDAPLIERLPFKWRGVDLGRVDRDGGEVAARRSAAAVLPEGHVTRRGISLPGILEPDATLTGPHFASGAPASVLVEYDRTLRASKQRDRFRRYDRFLTETWRESRFADHHSAPVAIYLLQLDRHLAAFLKEADKHFTAWLGPREAGPAQGMYPGRDLMLFTTRERLVAGDWTMKRLPAQPPDVRGASVLHPRETPMPIMRLFAPLPATDQAAA
jgi:hypothetical protein